MSTRNRSPSPGAKPDRDYAADSDDSLARKRQRMSEEPEPIVEVLAPEDVGATFQTAITIEDSTGATMNYGDTFDITGNTALPSEQAQALTRIIDSTAYLKPGMLRDIADWLRDHLDATADHASVWQRRYMDDEEFFHNFAFFAIKLLNCGDALNAKDLAMNPRESRVLLYDLYNSLCDLSLRILSFMPTLLDGVLARRDSAQPTDSGQQRAPLTLYLGVLSNLLDENTPLTQHLLGHLQVDLPELTSQLAVKTVGQEFSIKSLNTILRVLSARPRDFNDSWPIIEFTISALTQATLRVEDDYHASPQADQIDVMVNTINELIVPAICQKHPRALPYGFHQSLVDSVTALLPITAAHRDMPSMLRLYQSCWKSSHGPFPSGLTEGELSEERLIEACDGDQSILAELIKDLWLLQVLKGYVSTDILDIRSKGIMTLRNTLSNKWQAHSSSDDKLHPVLRYMAHFLREGNFTEYIFSADSHANLVKQSSDILAFLAVTMNYTDLETDVIWRACTTSVEAEFVRASYDVFNSIFKHLTVHQMVYIARKFTQVPASAIALPGTKFLQGLLNEIRAKSALKSDATRLEPARICFDILKNQNADASASSSEALHKIAISEILMLRDPRISVEDRLEIFKLCHVELASRTEHIKTAFQVLLCFLYPDTDPEAELILELFPVAAVVENLVEYVCQIDAQEQKPTQRVFEEVQIRLDTCLRLIGLTDQRQSPELEERLWAHTIGGHAISSQAREHALDQFISVPYATRSPASVVELFNRCIHQFLPTMPADCATARLARYLLDGISDVEAAARPTDSEAVLNSRPWQQLCRIANNTSSPIVANAAVEGICQTLFKLQKITGLEKGSYELRQATFARQHIEYLHSLQQSRAQGEENSLLIERGIYILGSLLKGSRQSAAGQKASDAQIRVEGDDSGGRIQFKVDIIQPKGSPTVRIVDAPACCTMEEFEETLKGITGANSHDLVRGGEMKPLSRANNLTAQSLSDANLDKPPGVTIRPRYSFDCDSSKVFHASNPVEDEVVANFELLETMLDSPDQSAERIFNFLITIPPPSKTRSQIASDSSSPAQLFPDDREWRTMYSIHVLVTHLSDCNKLGIADQGFIMRGARRLSDLLLDTDRSFSANLLSKLFMGLNSFLQGSNARPFPREVSMSGLTIDIERPKSSPPPPYLLNAEQLGLRLFDIMAQIQTMSLPPPMWPMALQLRSRVALTKSAYIAFLHLSRTEGLWEKIESTQRFVDVHGSLLLSEDSAVSLEISGLMKDFAKESAEAPSSYLRTLRVLLPDALANQWLSHHGFFTIFSDVIMADQTMNSDEGSVRRMIASLEKHLWRYQHRETANLPVADDTLCNLLVLLNTSIDVLKGFKQPLCLEGLSQNIFQRLLFSDAKIQPKSRGDNEQASGAGLALRPGSSASAAGFSSQAIQDDDPMDTDVDRPVRIQPLFHPNTRAICLDLVRKTSETVDHHCWLLERLKELVGHAQAYTCGFPSGNWSRSAESCAGLSNLGMTCYMNSLLQQIFANVQLRKVLFDTPITDHQKHGLLEQVQALFARMQNHAQTYVDTGPLARFLGVHVDTQEDVHGFYTNFMSGLESCMPDAESKASFTGLFSGKLATQIRGSCGHVSSRTEPFSDLSLTLQNKSSLADSLAEFVQGEPMQGANKYKCLSCEAENGGKLVDAMRRTCLDEVPDHLTVCLKRFTYDMLGQESKSNDYFEFPQEIDLSQYQRAGLEAQDGEVQPDIFTLVGVIVHSGILTFGHYWSFVRLRGGSDPDTPRWVRLEDRQARESNFEELRKECYGGNDSTHNGYVLFYQRKSSFEVAPAVAEKLSCSTQRQDFLPPRVRLSDDLSSEVLSENIKHHRLGQLFDDGFHRFVLGVLQDSVARTQTVIEEDREALPPPESESGPNCGDHMGECQRPSDALLAETMFKYLIHVLLAEATPNKASHLFQVFKAQAGSRPKLMHHLLTEVTKDDRFFWYMAKTLDANMNTVLRDFLTTDCLRNILKHDPDNYDFDVRRMVTAHSDLLSGMDAYPSKWFQYFFFACRLSQCGTVGYDAVVDAGYLGFALGALSLGHVRVPGFRQLAELRKKRRIDYAPLYEFLNAILDNQTTMCWEDFQHEGRLSNAMLLTHTVEVAGRHMALPWIKHAMHMDAPDNFQPARLVDLLCSRACDETKLLVQESLRTCIRVEEGYTRPLFLMNVPLLASMGDNSASQRHLDDLIVGVLEHNRPPVRWTLELLSAIWSSNPVNVLNTVYRWAPLWLTPDSRVPKRTQNWLSNHIFAPAPLHETTPNTFGNSVDFARAQTTARLISSCMANTPMVEMSDRGDLACVIEAIKEALSYLQRLQKDARAVAEHEDRKLAEVFANVNALTHPAVLEGQRLLAELKEWDAEALVVEDDDPNLSSVWDSDEEDEDM